MKHQKLKIKLKIDGDDRIYEFRFYHHKSYLQKFKDLQEDYEILEETTVSCLTVRRKQDLFGEVPHK